MYVAGGPSKGAFVGTVWVTVMNSRERCDFCQKKMERMGHRMRQELGFGKDSASEMLKKPHLRHEEQRTVLDGDRRPARLVSLYPVCSSTHSLAPTTDKSGTVLVLGLQGKCHRQGACVCACGWGD